jgi:hypothetical protein
MRALAVALAFSLVNFLEQHVCLVETVVATSGFRWTRVLKCTAQCMLHAMGPCFSRVAILDLCKSLISGRAFRTSAIAPYRR